ncbi:MAG: LytTR family DNA-binding domain-containing protein [Bacteroidota bacterium]
MKILIVEDELRVAKLLEKNVRLIWEEVLTNITVINNLTEAEIFMSQNEIDLLFLDLNLNGRNGFDLLNDFVSRPFFTIVVSAYRDQAIKAFEYGVLDFIPKPFNQERLKTAYLRSIGQAKEPSPEIKNLTVKKKGKLLLVPVIEILYIKSDGHYAELHLRNDKLEISDKPLDRLEVLLQNDFIRIHRSYLVRVNAIKEVLRFPGSRYEIALHSDLNLPLSRTRYKSVISKVAIN